MVTFVWLQNHNLSNNLCQIQTIFWRWHQQLYHSLMYACHSWHRILASTQSQTALSFSLFSINSTRLCRSGWLHSSLGHPTQSHKWDQGQGHLVGPTSYQFIFLLFHAQQTTPSLNTTIGKFDLENPWKGQGHIVGPTLLQFISLSFLPNRTRRSWDTAI